MWKPNQQRILCIGAPGHGWSGSQWRRISRSDLFGHIDRFAPAAKIQPIRQQLKVSANMGLVSHSCSFALSAARSRIIVRNESARSRAAASSLAEYSSYPLVWWSIQISPPCDRTERRKDQSSPRSIDLSIIASLLGVLVHPNNGVLARIQLWTAGAELMQFMA